MIRFKRIILFILIAIVTLYQIGDAEIENKIDLDSSSNLDISTSTLSESKSGLEYKTVSTTVGGNGGTLMPTTDVYKHLAFQGADNTLVVMVNIKSDTDADPVMISDSMINQALRNAEAENVKTKMIKLHLGINYSDSYSRGDYSPNADEFFSNWKDICLNYAEICEKNNIPILCIGCEQVKQTVDANYNYWADVVSTIRSKYPKLLLTYAAHSDEYEVDSPLKIWGLFDFIGFNMYFHYTNKLVSEDPTLEEMIQAYYSPIYKQQSMMDIVNLYAKTFNKKIFITETGLMPKDKGLSYPYDPESSNEPTTYYGTSLAIRAVFNGLCTNENIAGIAWWHVDAPFDYFNDNEITKAEKAMKECLEEN